jgi:hypothetical protein
MYVHAAQEMDVCVVPIAIAQVVVVLLLKMAMKVMLTNMQYAKNLLIVGVFADVIANV